MLDLIIIGGGPGGAAAGVYAARKQLKTELVTKEWGGQSVVSPDIQNWIGTVSISGNDFSEALKKHLEAYKGDTLTITPNSLVAKVEKKDDGFAITLDNGSTRETKAVLVTSGSTRRKLAVKGADIFEQKGLTYCASCDGPLFSGQDVVVIGGGNAGFETAAQLLAYTKSVTLLNRSAEFKADPITTEKVLANSHMTAIRNAEPTEVFGDTFVTGIRYKDTATGEEKELAAGGVFVEIGLVPNTGFISDLVEADEYQRIKIDPWTQATSVPGIWAAGDCTNIKYHQNNISAGDAVKALEDIYVNLRTR
ncbi:FAD-dependent oxidoreductase [Candidatus Kaiserbacteria bacterium]|nr:FAD-dependent oxidoreductase [Candidatus Kaiserbacteria bacterium]